MVSISMDGKATCYTTGSWINALIEKQPFLMQLLYAASLCSFFMQHKCNLKIFMKSSLSFSMAKQKYCPIFVRSEFLN